MASTAAAALPAGSTPAASTAKIYAWSTTVQKAAPPADTYDSVNVLWGTNRAAVDARPIKAASQLGYGRSEDLKLGISTISVPKVARPVGGIPRPAERKILFYPLNRDKEDPAKHFTVVDLRQLTRGEFLLNAARQMEAAQGFKDHALIFVHGYNASFEDALYRAAQLAYDMSFDGAVHLFSWPSRGEYAGYGYDRDSVDFSVSQFREFLRLVESNPRSKNIHILAHSMGARLAIDTLLPSDTDPRRASVGKIKQVILVAADADQSVFEQRARRYPEVAKTMTLYAHADDKALKISVDFARGVPRVGGIVDGLPTIVAGADTIDMTGVDQGSLAFWAANHSSYVANRHILRDIALLLRHGRRPPHERSPTYLTLNTYKGPFWKYVPN
ncbi:MAG: alpha/beta fold hydrolase [Hyphomicrobiaceae bacterium]|nr:alpha/beta fold hydrolase [Hyphomicrobiaceae bacterium]